MTNEGQPEPGVVDLAAAASTTSTGWWTEEDERLAEIAYLEADAWAKSDPGTPYGGTEVVRGRRP